MATYKTVGGETLSAICRDHYGKPSGAVEVVLEANPRLARYGVVLPAGITVTLPEIETETTEQTVRLFG